MAAGKAQNARRHRKRRYDVTVKAVILLLSFCLPILADLAAGQQAMKNRDYAAALHEFLPLANAGDAIAQFNLGMMYDAGQGVAQDYAEAARWYRKAADQEYATAQVNLGNLYSHGQGVPQDYTEAARWYRRAAEHGNADAQYELGMVYANGQSVKRDYIEAYMWLNLASSRTNGDVHAQFLNARELIAEKMSAKQIAEGQRRAREWSPTKSQ
jgi:hypothetical protein